MDGLTLVILTSLGGAALGCVVWISKAVGERLIKKFFDQAELLEENKDSMLNEKLNRMNNDSALISNAMKTHGEEMARTKIMMQSLNHQIDSFRAELKASDKFNQKSFLDMSKILSYVNNQLKIQAEELKTLGNVIFKDWPERK